MVISVCYSCLGSGWGAEVLAPDLLTNIEVSFDRLVGARKGSGGSGGTSFSEAGEGSVETKEICRGGKEKFDIQPKGGGSERERSEGNLTQS